MKDLDKKKQKHITTDLKRLMGVSGFVVIGLVGVMFFSPLSTQFYDDGASRGESWRDDVEEMVEKRDYAGALHYVDSLIEEKEQSLPRFAYFDRFLSENDRMNAANSRADIYDLQWARIEILQNMNDRSSLMSELEDYCRVIGYNQDKAKVMLKQLKRE